MTVVLKFYTGIVCNIFGEGLKNKFYFFGRESSYMNGRCGFSIFFGK